MYKRLLIAFGVIGLLAFGHYLFVGPTIRVKSVNLADVSGSDLTWRTYQNKKYGFEFSYPPDFEITEPTFFSSAKLVVLATGPNSGDHNFSVRLTITDAPVANYKLPKPERRRRALVNNGLVYDFRGEVSSPATNLMTEADLYRVLRSLVFTN